MPTIPTVIATAGKGSSGKTLIAASLIPALSARGNVLVVDADPNSSLADLLGHFDPTRTLGYLRSRYQTEIDRGERLEDQTRLAFTEQKMAEEVLQTQQGYDFLAMGRWQLAGSQCTVNNTLERALEHLVSRYDYVLVDNEAGLEPMGRSKLPIHLFLLTALPHPPYLRVAERIKERALETGRVIGKTVLVLNQCRDFSNDMKMGRTWQVALEAQHVLYLPHSAVLQTIGATETPFRNYINYIKLDPFFDEAQSGFSKLLPPLPVTP